MKFSDPNERDRVLGPLYATVAKAQIPIFGPDKFTSKDVQKLLEVTLKGDLLSEYNPVVNLLSTETLKMDQKTSSISVSGGSLGEYIDNLKPNLQGDEKAEPRTSNKIYSHQELHDQAHYTTQIDPTLTESNEKLLDRVMLQRAMRGYLFNCNINQDIVKDDVWLQDVWEWIEGR